MIRAILAADKAWGIGNHGELPWPHNGADLIWFKQTTHGQTVVMGRKTWDSLPIKPLPSRNNIVITSNPTMDDMVGNFIGTGPDSIMDIDTAKRVLPTLNDGTSIWIIGGAMLIEELLGIIDEIWISRIDNVHSCDTFLPKQKIRTWYHETHIAHPTLNIEKWVKRGL